MYKSLCQWFCPQEEEEMAPTICAFDPTVLAVDPHKVLVVGAAGTGKTLLIESFPPRKTAHLNLDGHVGEIDNFEHYAGPDDTYTRVVVEDAEWGRVNASQRAAFERAFFGSQKSIVLAAQSIRSVPPNIRHNMRYVFVAEKTARMAPTDFHREWFGFIPYNQFEAMVKIFKPYEFLVCDTHRQVAYFYRAPDPVAEQPPPQ